MGERGDDLVRVQVRILEFLGHEVPFQGGQYLKLKPVCIAVNIGYKDHRYIGKNCRELVEMGLLERHESSFYQITERGRAYLAGELDAADLGNDE